MQLQLAYGRQGLDVELPDENMVKVLRCREMEPLATPDRRLEELLDRPLGTRSLTDMAAGKRSACILICDITRPVPNGMMLRPILERIEAAGVPREEILILIATGLHRPNLGEEQRELVGDYVYENFRIENHDGLNQDSHDYLGESPNGVPIWLDRRYLQADLKITVGLIEPHFMAGYSGGRKLICPGIAALPTVKAWHSPRFLESPQATSGVLEGNPVHIENTWIAKQAGCDLIANVVIDDERRPLEFFVGDMEHAFLAGVEFVRGVVRDTVEAEVDVVVTSSAGYPLDNTFYQSIKGMVGAANIVKQGGTVVIAASLEEGIGSEPFQEIFAEQPDLETFMNEIMADRYFKMDQWQLEELAKVVRKARVVVVSHGIDQETLRGLYVESAATVEQAVAEALADKGPAATVAAIPEGPYVIAAVGA